MELAQISKRLGNRLRKDTSSWSKYMDEREENTRTRERDPWGRHYQILPDWRSAEGEARWCAWYSMSSFADWIEPSGVVLYLRAP